MGRTAPVCLIRSSTCRGFARRQDKSSLLLNVLAWRMGNVLFNDTLNTFNLQEGRQEMFYLTTHSTHFIYGYMVSDMRLRTILIVRKETRCRHIGYSLQLTARVLLYAPSHRQDSTYHGLCYTSRSFTVTWRQTYGQIASSWVTLSY